MSVRWWIDPNKCPHYNENVCATCDFDGYYATTYTDCPWRDLTDEDIAEERLRARDYEGWSRL